MLQYFSCLCNACMGYYHRDYYCPHMRSIHPHFTTVIRVFDDPLR